MPTSARVIFENSYGAMWTSPPTIHYIFRIKKGGYESALTDYFVIFRASM